MIKQQSISVTKIYHERNDSMAIRWQLRRAREQNGLTLKEAANKLKISYSCLVRLENGEKHKISVELLQKLCILYHVPPHILLGYRLPDFCYLFCHTPHFIRPSSFYSPRRNHLLSYLEGRDYLDIKRLIQMFHCLDHRGKYFIASMIENEFNRCKNTSQPDI